MVASPPLLSFDRLDRDIDSESDGFKPARGPCRQAKDPQSRVGLPSGSSSGSGFTALFCIPENPVQTGVVPTSAILKIAGDRIKRIVPANPEKNY
jgi:hypothetical protein